MTLLRPAGRQTDSEAYSSASKGLLTVDPYCDLGGGARPALGLGTVRHWRRCWISDCTQVRLLWQTAILSLDSQIPRLFFRYDYLAQQPGFESTYEPRRLGQM